jgi:hypothetical protein
MTGSTVVRGDGPADEDRLHPRATALPGAAPGLRVRRRHLPPHPHVTAAPRLSRCPRHGLRRLRTRNPAARDRLVSPGPTAALVCRYRESNKIVNGRPSFPLQLAETDAALRSRTRLPGRNLRHAAPRQAWADRLGIRADAALPGGLPLPQRPRRLRAVSYGGCGYALNDPRHPVFQATQGLRAGLNSLLPAGPTRPR